MIEFVREALAVAIQVRQPVLVWGPPGEGKTSLIQSVADQLGRPCEVVIGSLREASDFAGLPMRVDGGVSFAPPAWALRCVESPDTVVLFDELTTADLAVQNAMLRVVLEREVGDLTLPSSVAIVAAANPTDTAVGGSDLSAPLANRFLHIDYLPSITDWISGMTSGWIHEDLPTVHADRQEAETLWRTWLTSFIATRPELLRQLPQGIEERGRAWPSPRSWDRAARIAAATDSTDVCEKVLQMLVVGLVGQGAGLEFLHFVRRSRLQDPETLLISPELFNPRRRTDEMVATLKAVVTAVAGQCTMDRWNSAWKLVDATCDAELVDIAAISAMELLRLRADAWAVPETVGRFAGLLADAQLA